MFVATVTIVITDTNNVNNVHCYCAFAGLVRHHNPKLGPGYLNIEARRAVSNLVTRTRALVWERPRGFEKAMHASWQRPRGWLGRQCARVSGGALACGDQS
jgi:hypothetical protein